MQIHSTRRPAAGSKKPEAQPVPEQQQKVFKPFQESWQIGEDTFASTEELIQAQNTLENVEAVYRFQTEESPAPFSSSERVRNAAGGAVMGTAFGAIGGGVVGAGLTVLGTAGDILGGFMGGRMNGTSAALMFVPLAIGAALGAGVGGFNGYKMEPAVSGGEVRGILSKNENGTSFFPNGKVDRKVDLNTFKDAPIPDVTPEKKPESRPVRNALLGAGAGVALIPGQVIPLVGVFGPTYAGAQIGEALDKRTLLGTGAGMLGGAAATGAAIYALSQVTGYGEPNYAALIGVAGGLAATGAVLGDRVITAMNTEPAHRDYGQQWWNQNSGSQQA